MTMPFRAFLFSAALATPALAAAQQTGPYPTDPLLDLLQLEETIAIMRVEGIDYADELVADMAPGATTSNWGEVVDDIYDPGRMEATVRAGFAEAFPTGEMDTAPLEAFFGSDLGREVVSLEVSARDAMSDEAIEEAARETWRARREDPDDRLDQIAAFVEANDLIEANVVGGLNTTMRFYEGLADGGALEMSEEEILREVWMSEEDTRADTEEWINAFLLMAYKPLEDAELARYAELAATPEGQAMNRALFAGFDAMYGDISYALGRAIAREMTSQEL